MLNGKCCEEAEEEDQKTQIPKTEKENAAQKQIRHPVPLFL
jgi:hypothetical protein